MSNRKKMTRTARMLSKGGTAGGPKPKPKGMMAGGVPKPKPKGMMAGGVPKPKPKGMSAGGAGKQKLKMVTDPKTGDSVPFFKVDENGVKKKGGGDVPNSKGYFKGGKI